MHGLWAGAGERVVGVWADDAVVEAVVGIGMRPGALAGGAQGEVVFELRDGSAAVVTCVVWSAVVVA